MASTSNFFDQFPTVSYDLTGNINNAITVPNIFFRLKLVDALRNNSVIYYPYYCQEGDTPEIIAYKYYQDISKGWLILLTNNIIDPQFDWFLDYTSFIKYIQFKYGGTSSDPAVGIQNAQTQIAAYQKIITKTNSSGNFVTTINIDATTYNNTSNYEFQEVNLSDGTTTSITTTTNILYAFDVEYSLNEQKRLIQIIAKEYLDQIEQEFEALTNQAKLGF